MNKEKFTQNTNVEEILITLQFTEDHTPEENKKLLEDLQLFIQENSNQKFVLKHHPRFKNEINNQELLKYSNVSITDKPLTECLRNCKIHSTAYSTTVIYPINTLNDTLRMYNDLQLEVEDWYKNYYEPLKESQWLNQIQ